MLYLSLFSKRDAVSLATEQVMQGAREQGATQGVLLAG